FQSDSFLDLLQRVTGEYCQAFEHADSSRFTAQASRPEFTRNTGFNWLPLDTPLEVDDAAESGKGLKCSPFDFVHPMPKVMEVDLEPSILLSQTEEGITGDVHFPLKRFSADTMERFGQAFLVLIDALLRNPERNIREIPLS
ncbi:MAG: hypothetical protein ABI885_30580, partial [Gammaproteobacteria bacterium]